MKHQYDALSSVEQGEAVELERPASPDTLVNDQEQEATEAPITNTANYTSIFAPSPTPISFPSSMASVNDVRQYVISVLHDSFHVPLQEAETAASRWQGLGHRLHMITFEDLREVLGDPYASMVQQYADAVCAHHRRVNAQSKKQPNGFLAASLTIAAMCLFALIVIRLGDS